MDDIWAKRTKKTPRAYALEHGLDLRALLRVLVLNDLSKDISIEIETLDKARTALLASRRS
jgi:hypothetical protein